MRLWDIVRNVRPVAEKDQLNILNTESHFHDHSRKEEPRNDQSRKGQSRKDQPRKDQAAGTFVLSGDLMIREVREILSTLDVRTRETEAGTVYYPAVLSVCSEDRSSIGEIRLQDLFFFSEHLEKTYLEEILDDIEIGVIAADAEGRIFFVNHAYEELLGVPVHRTIGRNIFRIEPESDLCEAIRSRKEVMNPRKYVQSADRYVSLRIHPLTEKEKFAGAVSLFTDVTELETLNTEIRRMSGMVEEFRHQLEENYQRTGVLTRDRDFLRLLDQAAVAAKTDVPILIRGENGVGKEVVARYIHRASVRSSQPLVIVNCASIPETLIESELFGYEEGSFTGAKRGGKMGKFELANHGTIFLDEIGDMPVALQSRLLRVIQNGEIEKIGRQKTVPVDVRILAATNQPLEDLIARKAFREDLFYRLNVISLLIPPLRERREDIPLLAEHFVKEYTKKYGCTRSITAKGYRNLMGHAWSGNVRELQNCIERAVILSPEKNLEFEEFAEETVRETKTGKDSRNHATGREYPGVEGERSSAFASAASGPRAGEAETADVIGMPEAGSSGVDWAETKVSSLDAANAAYISAEGLSLAEAMERFEKELILQALERAGGKREQAIRLLGLSRRTFYRKCAQHGISG